MKTALIAIDFINDVVHPESPMACAASQIAERGVLGRVNAALAHARAKGWFVVLVKVGFASGYAECPMHSPLFGVAGTSGVLRLGTWGTQFHEALESTPVDAAREFIVTKSRVSAFYATSLEAMLRANAIDTLFLCGVSTTWAVQSTARDAHDRDYRVRVIEDACAADRVEEHRASIRQLSRIGEIVSSDNLPAA